MPYNTWLVLHILGVVIFLGNIIVTAVWKVLADRTRNPAVVGYGPSASSPSRTLPSRRPVQH